MNNNENAAPNCCITAKRREEINRVGRLFKFAVHASETNALVQSLDLEELPGEARVRVAAARGLSGSLREELFAAAALLAMPLLLDLAEEAAASKTARRA